MGNLHFVELSNGDIVCSDTISCYRTSNGDNYFFGNGFCIKNGEKFDIEGHQFICESVILDPKEKRIINPADLPFGRCLAEELSHVKEWKVNHENGMTTVQADGEDFLKIKDSRLIEVKLHHITEIGHLAFLNCRFLTSAVIHEDVEKIRKNVFYGCSPNLVITCATKKQKEFVKNSGFAGEIRIQPNSEEERKESVEKSGFAGENRIQPQRVAKQKSHLAQQTRSL